MSAGVAAQCVPAEHVCGSSGEVGFSESGFPDREDDGAREEGFALCVLSHRSLAGMRCLWGLLAPSSPFQSPVSTWSMLGLRLLALPSSWERLCLPVLKAWAMSPAGTAVTTRDSRPSAALLTSISVVRAHLWGTFCGTQCSRRHRSHSPPASGPVAASPAQKPWAGTALGWRAFSSAGACPV